MLKKVLGFVIVMVTFPLHAEVIDLPFDEVWDKALVIILDQEGIPEYRDKELGVIRSEYIPMQLDKETADCGKMFGMPYIKDKRTKTSVRYSIRLKPIDGNKTDVEVKADIQGYFFKNETSWAVWTEKTRDADKVLECQSTGSLEQKYLNQLKGE